MNDTDRIQSIFEILEANVNEVEELRIFTLQVVNLLMSISQDLGLTDEAHPKSASLMKDLLKSNDQIMQAVLSRQERMKSLILKLEQSGLKGQALSVERTELPSVEDILADRL